MPTPSAAQLPAATVSLQDDASTPSASAPSNGAGTNTIPMNAGQLLDAGQAVNAGQVPQQLQAGLSDNATDAQLAASPAPLNTAPINTASMNTAPINTAQAAAETPAPDVTSGSSQVDRTSDAQKTEALTKLVSSGDVPSQQGVEQTGSLPTKDRAATPASARPPAAASHLTQAAGSVLTSETATRPAQPPPFAIPPAGIQVPAAAHHDQTQQNTAASASAPLTGTSTLGPAAGASTSDPRNQVPQMAAVSALPPAVPATGGAPDPVQSVSGSNSSQTGDGSGQPTDRDGRKSASDNAGTNAVDGTRFGMGGWIASQPVQAAGSMATPEPVRAPAGGDMAQLATDRVASDSSARRVNNALQSDMSLGVQTDGFGRVRIQTSMLGGQLSAQIALEHGHAGSGALSAQMPELEARLSEKYNVPASVNVRADAGSTNGGGQSSPRDDHGQQAATRLQTASSLFSGGVNTAGSMPSQLPAAWVQTPSVPGRLDIRI
ncbi:MAG: hypothetical protein ACRYGF_01500 [Janthinobacterium lividum]